LEFLARLSDKRFPNNAIGLETKLEMLLKILFVQILKKQPIPVSNEVDEESESDEEY
jgi:hypothetical protein